MWWFVKLENLTGWTLKKICSASNACGTAETGSSSYVLAIIIAKALLVFGVGYDIKILFVPLNHVAHRFLELQGNFTTSRPLIRTTTNYKDYHKFILKELICNYETY